MIVWMIIDVFVVAGPIVLFYFISRLIKKRTVKKQKRQLLHQIVGKRIGELKQSNTPYKDDTILVLQRFLNEVDLIK